MRRQTTRSVQRHFARGARFALAAVVALLVALVVGLLGAACNGSSPAASADAPVVRPDAPSGPGADFLGGTAYEIFVRSFADSNGDGVGDLAGLTAHLDHVSTLGAEAVWLMPIFPSPSYHGYDVRDYRAINPQYGTLDDFDAFVAAAHARGVAVLLDFVLNHASSQHPFFQDAAGGPSAAKRDWFVFSPTDLHWMKPWDHSDPWVPLNGFYYYALFSPGMPDWNLGNPAVEAELVDAMKFWMARGVDGFRLDAVRYFFESSDGQLADQPASHAFLRRVRAALQATSPKVTLVAEAWAELPIQASYWGAGDEANLAFSFDLAEAIKGSAHDGTAAEASNLLLQSEAEFAGKDRGYEAPFLSNHDQVRVMRVLENDAGAARVAAATLFALPGTPFVYYGEEIGMVGNGASDDTNKRTAFRWTGAGPGFGFTTGTPWFSSNEAAGVDVATEQADPGSLLRLYETLIALRRAQPALRGAAAHQPTVAGGGDGLLALLRTAPDGARVLFVVNYAKTSTGAFTVDVSGSATSLYAEGLQGAPASSGGKLAITDLAARGFAYLALN